MLGNEFWPTNRFYATLGKSLAEPEQKSEPVWAQPQFYFAFTGLPPVEVYENLNLFDEGM